MPILQYQCPKCGKQFEELVKDCKEVVLCPDCQAKANRDWSGRVYSALGKPAPHCSGNCSTCSGCK